MRGHRGDCHTAVEGLLEHAALHVGPDRQAEPVENRGSNVEEAGAEHEFIVLESRPRGREHALGPVPDGDPGRHARRELGPQVVAVEAVIGDHHHGRIGAGELHEPLEKH